MLVLPCITDATNKISVEFGSKSTYCRVYVWNVKSNGSQKVRYRKHDENHIFQKRKIHHFLECVGSFSSSGYTATNFVMVINSLQGCFLTIHFTSIFIAFDWQMSRISSRVGPKIRLIDENESVASIFALIRTIAHKNG